MPDRSYPEPTRRDFFKTLKAVARRVTPEIANQAAPKTVVLYNPSMAQFRDGVTELQEGGLAKTIDNVMVLPLSDGGADLILTHTLKESDGIVLNAEIVGRWHFGSVEHLQRFSEMLADSIKRTQTMTDADKDKIRADFEHTVKGDSRKTDGDGNIE